MFKFSATETLVYLRNSLSLPSITEINNLSSAYHHSSTPYRSKIQPPRILLKEHENKRNYLHDSSAFNPVALQYLRIAAYYSIFCSISDGDHRYFLEDADSIPNISFSPLGS